MKCYGVLIAIAIGVGLTQPSGAGDTPFPNMSEPIIIDVNDDGYQLTSPTAGVRFDLRGNGNREQVAWTAADSDDAFLAIDENHNGVVDSGRELFAGVLGPPNGFSTLAAYNGFRTVDDLKMGRNRAATGILTPADAVFAMLLLWTDRNHNGMSEENELESLAHAGFTKIYLGYEDISQLDSFGNLFRYEGKASRRTQNGVEVLRRATAIRLRPAAQR